MASTADDSASLASAADDSANMTSTPDDLTNMTSTPDDLINMTLTADDSASMASTPDESASMTTTPDDAAKGTWPCSCCKEAYEMDDDEMVARLTWRLERNELLFKHIENGTWDQVEFTPADCFAMYVELENREAEIDSRIRRQRMRRIVEDAILNWDPMPGRPRGSV